MKIYDKCIILDFDCTIGYFKQIIYLLNIIEKYNGIEIIENSEYFQLFDCYPYIFRPKIYDIFNLILTNKEKIKFFILYTNNQNIEFVNLIFQYIKSKLKIKNYEIKFKETGAIPLFHPKNIKKINQMEIGTAGGMTRLSTGYTFMNIQDQSKYIRENFESIEKVDNFTINSKYEFLDNIFLKVLKKNSGKMPGIFLKCLIVLQAQLSIFYQIKVISMRTSLLF